MTKGFLKKLLTEKATVYTFEDLRYLWPDVDIKTIQNRVSYYIDQGDLYHIRRGIYARNKDYNRWEVATSLYRPSYISFETVLKSAGMIFQYYSQIFVATYKSKTVECDRQIYEFKTIKRSVLTNSLGLEVKDHYTIASPERAFLDALYLYKRYHFDNLAPLNWDKVYKILPIYFNKRLEKQVQKYHGAFKNSLKESL